MAFHDKCACGGKKQRRNVRCALCHNTNRPITKDHPTGDSMSVTGNAGTMTKVTHEEVRTLADLVRVCQIDTTEWEITRWVANAWHMGSVNRKTGGTQATPLFQIKAWLTRRVELVDARAEIASLVDDAVNVIPRQRYYTAAVPFSEHPSPLMLEVGIPDLHLGKLAWGEETGDSNYDIRLAREVFNDALSSLLRRAGSQPFAKVLFAVGNDLLHSDTKQGTTTAGTQLDNDSRFQKTFMSAREMVTGAIERLRTICEDVDVVMVPGNHDQLSTWHLGDSLTCLYRGDPTVHVFNSANPRKYVQWGKVMLLLTHGDFGKLADLPLLMATEQPKMFGATLHREAHTGHLHQLRVQEHKGVRVRILSALCPPDAWHAQRMFVGMKRSAEAFVWHQEEGLIATANYTVPEPVDEAA